MSKVLLDVFLYPIDISVSASHYLCPNCRSIQNSYWPYPFHVPTYL